MKEFYPEGILQREKENGRYLTPAGLQAAYKEGKILEGTAILCDASHNLTVDLKCMKGIIPREEGALGIKEGTTRDIALISRVGKPVCFTVTGFKEDKEGRRYALLSRRAAQERCRESFISALKAGDITDAKVTHLEAFGAFCDIGCGIVALLPIDSVSVSRISHPKDRFCVGDEIRVAVKSSQNGKITLTLKELLGTWSENAEQFCAGQTVTGIVRSIEDYGVFVELTANLAGLAEPCSDIFPGKHVCVYIKSINPEKMKIKLVIIDSFESDEKTPLKYYYGENRISEFNYSPKASQKQINTVFSNND